MEMNRYYGLRRHDMPKAGDVFSFVLSPNEFDPRLLPPHARVVGSDAFREAVSKFLQDQFEGFGGSAQIRVDRNKIEVAWKATAEPLDAIVRKLETGRYPEAIVLLKLLLSRNPADTRILYNLGMALSDVGQVETAQE